MNLSAVPYLLVSRDLGPPCRTRVFVCLCLLDHSVLGVGRDRQSALDAMTREFEQRHGSIEGSADHDNLEMN